MLNFRGENGLSANLVLAIVCKHPATPRDQLKASAAFNTGNNILIGILRLFHVTLDQVRCARDKSMRR